MNNILISVQRFFKNKNVVTIGVILIVIALLYFVYVSELNRAINPVDIPVAAVEIQPRTEIKKQMVTTISVPSIAVNENVLNDTTNILGKYTNINSYIPEGSMFYSEQLVTKDQLPDSAFEDVKEGEIPYQFAVDMTTSYGNSIFPGNKIDLYMKAKDVDGKIMVGRLLADVEILSVKDSQGKNVFENTDDDRQPAFFMFGLPQELYIMLKKTEYLSDYEIEVFPVPHGGQAVSAGETKVGIQYLVDYVNALTTDLSIYEKTEVKDDATTKTDTTTKTDKTTKTNTTKNNTNVQSTINR